MTRSTTWLGSITPTGSAIKTGGPDGGARVSFDIPEDGMVALLELVTMRGKELRITVEDVTDQRLPFDEPPSYRDTVQADAADGELPF